MAKETDKPTKELDFFGEQETSSVVVDAVIMANKHEEGVHEVELVDITGNDNSNGTDPDGYHFVFDYRSKTEEGLEMRTTLDISNVGFLFDSAITTITEDNVVAKGFKREVGNSQSKFYTLITVIHALIKLTPEEELAVSSIEKPLGFIHTYETTYQRAKTIVKRLIIEANKRADAAIDAGEEDADKTDKPAVLLGLIKQMLAKFIFIKIPSDDKSKKVEFIKFCKIKVSTDRTDSGVKYWKIDISKMSRQSEKVNALEPFEAHKGRAVFADFAKGSRVKYTEFDDQYAYKAQKALEESNRAGLDKPPVEVE